MTLVKITHVQFDSDDLPPDFKPFIRIYSHANHPVEVQHELCEALEISYGVPVDYVSWEPAHDVRDSTDSPH